MAFRTKHAFQSAVADAGVSGQLGPSEWNADHIETGYRYSAGGRLTLSATDPIADVSGGTTVYYLPFSSSACPVYDGTDIIYLDISTGISQTIADSTKSPAAGAASKVYDLFVWNDSGTVRLSRGPAWPSSTSRGTGAGSSELTRSVGLIVNANAITNGPAANRGTWVGTIYTDASVQCNDNDTDRTVYNAYNKVSRRLYQAITENTWTYAAASWRQIQGASTYRFNYLRGGMGLDEYIHAHFTVDTNDVTGVYHISWGDNSTSTISGLAVLAIEGGNSVHWRGIGSNGVGLNTLYPIEYVAGALTTTVYGDAGATYKQNGIQGMVRA